MRSRGQMIPRGNNKWLLRIYLGTENGKRRYSAKTIEGTTAQARKELTAMQRELDAKTFVEPSKQTLGEYLAGWLKSKVDVSAKTLTEYTRMVKLYVAPGLGSLKLHEIEQRIVQGFVQTLAERGLAPRTVQYIHQVLKGALRQAVEWNLLLRNPAENVRLPKKVKRAPTVLTMKQVALLLETTKNDLLCPLWRLLLTSGLRPQEALALKWSDMDGEWLMVQRALVEDGHGAYTLSDSTKTEGSVRRIGLPASTVESLKAHKVRQNAEILVAGAKYDRQDLIFANSVGHPCDPNLVRRRWKTALKAARLPSIRLYDARHTHFTELLKNGADISWIAARAGHKDIKMTQQHYAHVMPETHREMGAMTERMLKKAENL